MKFYSTNDKELRVDLKTAVLNSLPADNGLYMPEEIPVFSKSFFESIGLMSFKDIAFTVAKPFLQADFTEVKIREIIDSSMTFEAPLVKLDQRLSVLELWHGRSLAFKDFGASFMASLMSKLMEKDKQRLTILVATSGDTGGAVGAGFLGVEGVDVHILFPKDKVSPLQENQLTCLGQNITAIEVDGTFDDCQAIVKEAFLDADINSSYNLSSANSINISRLIPQSFYYFEAYKQWLLSSDPESRKLVFCVPSGNFGNLTAGIMAKKMGLPVTSFIAATNVNDVVPAYLRSGVFEPRSSIRTISNAMDVGNPSNFSRILDLYDSSLDNMRKDITGFVFSDDETRSAILEIKQEYNYMMDPHGSVGYLAAREYLLQSADNQIIILETAHPSKFIPVVEPLVGKVKIPSALSDLDVSMKKVISLNPSFDSFKAWMLSRAD